MQSLEYILAMILAAVCFWFGCVIVVRISEWYKWRYKGFNTIYVDVETSVDVFDWLTETISEYVPKKSNIIIQINHINDLKYGYSITIRGWQNKEAKRLWQYLCNTNHHLDHTLIFAHQIKGEKVEIDDITHFADNVQKE